MFLDSADRAQWKESLQKFCDTNPDCVVKIAWSMIEICISNSHINEFENLNLRTPVWRERNSLAPFSRHETGPSEALGINAAKPIEETIPQAIADSADVNDHQSITEQGRSKPAQHDSFASMILTSQSTSPSLPATDSQTHHINLSPTDGNQNMTLDSDRDLNTSLSPKENPLREWTPAHNMTTRQRPLSIRRTNRPLSFSEPVSSPVQTPAQTVICETNSIDALLAEYRLQSAQMEIEHTPTGMAMDQSSPISTPPAFEAAPSSFLSSPTSDCSIQIPTLEEFRPDQPTTPAAYQAEELETPTSCYINIESFGAIDEFSNESNSIILNATTCSS